MMRHFTRLIRMLSTRDYHDFEALYTPAYHGEEVNNDSLPDIATLFSERVQRDENKRLLGEMAEDDMSKEEVKRREKDSFGSPSRAGYTERIAVTRKLTLMAEMNERFVADWRLWRWVGDALGDGDDDD